MPVTEREVARIISAIEEGVEQPKPAIRFENGETVRVTDGPFQSFNGVVEQVDEERARLRVTVSILGRATLRQDTGIQPGRKDQQLGGIVQFLPAKRERGPPRLLRGGGGGANPAPRCPSVFLPILISPISFRSTRLCAAPPSARFAVCHLHPASAGG